MNIRTPPPSPARRDERSFLLQRAQPAMTGLTDGSLPTLGPILAVAFAWRGDHRHRQRRAGSRQLSAAGARC